jgi:hypothetical protein
MTDPAVAFTPNETYAPYQHGVDMDIWLKAPNGSYSLALVWPGVTVYPGRRQLFSSTFRSHFYDRLVPPERI